VESSAVRHDDKLHPRAGAICSEKWRAYGWKMSPGEATTLVATEGRETSPAMDAVAVIGEARPATSPNK
jgi:hypothetical protein